MDFKMSVIYINKKEEINFPKAKETISESALLKVQTKGYGNLFFALNG